MADASNLFEDSESVLLEELAVLESIYITELSVEKDEEGWPQGISVLLHPATGMDESKKYVCMTLYFQLPHEYPDEAPGIEVKNPRGLGEEELQSLIKDMKKLAVERKGGQMLYELIEMAKDCLTEGNIPHCECPICLEHFQEGDDFLKTDCYHYFHRPCLARFASVFVSRLQEEESASAPLHVNTEKQQNVLSCPMCRLPLTCDLSELLMETVPEEKDEEFVPSPGLIEQQQEMTALYEQQKAKGGIIDVEKEKNKYLVDENTVVSLDSLDRNVKESRHQSSSKTDEPSGEKSSAPNNLQKAEADRGDNHSCSKGGDIKPREYRQPATHKPHPRSGRSRRNHQPEYMGGSQGYSDYEEDCVDGVENLGDEKHGDRLPKPERRGNRTSRGGGRGDRNVYDRGENKGGRTTYENQEEGFRSSRGRGRGSRRGQRDNRQNLRDNYQDFRNRENNFRDGEDDLREGRTDLSQDFRDFRKVSKNETRDRDYHHKNIRNSMDDDCQGDREAPTEGRQDHRNYRSYRRGGHRDNRQGHWQGDHDKRYQESKFGRHRPEVNRNSTRENRESPRENRDSPRVNRDSLRENRDTAAEEQYSAREYHKVREGRLEGRHSSIEDIGEKAEKGQMFKDSPRESDGHFKPQKSRNNRRDFHGHHNHHDHQPTDAERRTSNDPSSEHFHGAGRGNTQSATRDDHGARRRGGWGGRNDVNQKTERGGQRAQGTAREDGRETYNGETVPDAEDFGKNRRSEGGRRDRTFFRGQGSRGGGRGRGRNGPFNSQSAAGLSHKTDDPPNARQQAHSRFAQSDRKHDGVDEHEEEDWEANGMKRKESLTSRGCHDSSQQPIYGDRTREGVSDRETRHGGSRKTPVNHPQHGRGQKFSNKENKNTRYSQKSHDGQHEKDGNFVSSTKDRSSVSSAVCVEFDLPSDSLSSETSNASKTANKSASEKLESPPGFGSDCPPPGFGKNPKFQSSNLSSMPSATVSPPPGFGFT